jgi:uncharacterized repeat protein (TIGR01451 family)
MKGMRKHCLLSAAFSAVAVVLLVPAGAQAASADLTLLKADSPDPVTQGAVLTYTIRVANLGPGTASSVTVTDELASTVDFVSATASQGTCELKGKTVTCALGSVPPSDYTGSAVTIRVRPTKTGPLTNTARVSVGAPDTDPNAANNASTATTTVVGGGGGGGATCAGRAATKVGTGGADVIVGTSGRDVIAARGGNDTVRGLGNKDIVCGGGGKDKIKGGAGNDRLKGGRGRDTLRGGGGGDGLFGGGGRDRCFGGPGHDTERSC